MLKDQEGLAVVKPPLRPELWVGERARQRAPTICTQLRSEPPSALLSVNQRLNCSYSVYVQQSFKCTVCVAWACTATSAPRAQAPASGRQRGGRLISCLLAWQRIPCSRHPTAQQGAISLLPQCRRARGLKQPLLKRRWVGRLSRTTEHL